MIKEIKYKGFTATPSDYECPDGELDAAINLVPDNGELAPIQKGESLFNLGSVYKILFIHKNATYRHIILSGEDDGDVWLYWIDIPNEVRLTDALKSIQANTAPVSMGQHSYHIGTELSVSAIGNTLIVTGDGNMHYILWKDNSYKYLGTHIPEIYLSFSLKGTVDYRTPEGGFAFDSSTLHIAGEQFGSEYYQIIRYAASKISDQVMGFVVEKTKAIKDAGYFVHPFFVRYALRLYDGTLTMHSAPILMNPCTTCNPFVYASSASESSVNVVAMFVKSELECRFLDDISGTLDDWEDIITGIDIFVSNQMCPYNQDGKIQGIETTTDTTLANIVTTGRGGGQSEIIYVQKSTKISESVFIGRLSTNSGDNYAQHKFTHIYGNNPRRRDGSTLDDTTYEGGSWPKYAFMLPYIEEDKIKENIINESRFYYLSSIRLEELESYTTRKKVEFNITRTEVDVPLERTEDVYTSALTSLLGAEVMTDDYHSHDTISPNSVFDYNSRLHLAGITRTLFNGFPLSSMLAYCNKRYNYSQGSFDYVNYADKYCIEVYLKIDGVNTKVVCRLDDDGVLLQNYLSDSQNSTLQPESWGCYLFYPDRNAYKMRIIHKGTDPFKNTTGDYFDIELKPHDFINGAYAFLDYYTIREKTGRTSVSESTNVRVSELGKIYTSDANNPFIFSTTNINTIGTGEILALATATKALSQGQFGQFPLYAFTTEGVWALEVAANGAFSAKQPITRDVCINADSITQLDNAVIFVTDRGIMLISGSDSICISDSINAESVFSINALPKLSDVCEEDINIGTVVPFMQFLHDARMLYDYTHQRIIVNNIDHDYAYVYSLKSKAWGMMKSDIAYGFPSYPECLAVDADNNIVNLSGEHNVSAQAGASNGYPQDNTVNALLITRPLKLDAPDILKTVDTIIQRGKFRKGNVKSILYGSRDLYNWHLVYSSNDHYLRGFRGTPYKYFRIVLLCELQEDESIFGCTVQFTPRLIDQPR